MPSEASKLPGPACSLASTYSHFLPGVAGRAGPEHPCLLPPEWDPWEGMLDESGVISRAEFWISGTETRVLEMVGKSGEATSGQEVGRSGHQEGQ